MITEYEELLRDNKGNEEKMWESVALVGDLLDKIKDTHPELYKSFMRKQYGIMLGNHFSEEFAEDVVGRMFHTDKKSGRKIEGEYFSMSKAEDVYDSIRGKIGADNNVYDVYVAINANAHDKMNLFSSWFEDGVDESIIEDAVEFYFLDEDAPDGKIYRYINAME